VWELEEADIDALEDTLEIPVERVSAKEDFPGVTIDTDEREHYVIGNGATAIKGGRDAVIGWLAWGSTDGLRYDGELPPPGPVRRLDGASLCQVPGVCSVVWWLSVVPGQVGQRNPSRCRRQGQRRRARRRRRRARRGDREGRQPWGGPERRT
jgi:hypothetical protein